MEESAALRLRRVGQRLTGQRRALLEILSASDRPLSIPLILRKARKLAQSSAYRNLAVLERAGVVHRVVTSGDFMAWELDEALGQHHHHLICSSCGQIEDVTLSPDVERNATAALDKAAVRAGYTVRTHRLDAIGLCANCSR